MELKLKEGVKVNSFTFKKEVEENVLAFFEKENFLENDVFFYTMICMLDAMAENNVIIEALADDDKIMETMVKDIEPLYEQYIKNNEENYKVFLNIVEDISSYNKRAVENKRTLGGILYKLSDALGNLTMEDLEKFSGFIQKSLIDSLNQQKKIGSQFTPEEKQLVQDSISTKMDDLIKKYSKPQGTAE